MLLSEQLAVLELQDHLTVGILAPRCSLFIYVHMRDRTDNPGSIMGILADILRRQPYLRGLTFLIFSYGYNKVNVFLKMSYKQLMFVAIL